MAKLVHQLQNFEGFDLDLKQQQTHYDALQDLNKKQIVVSRFFLYPELDPNDPNHLEKSLALKIPQDIYVSRQAAQIVASDAELRASLDEYSDEILLALKQKQIQFMKSFASSEILAKRDWKQIVESARLDGLQMDDVEFQRFASEVAKVKAETERQILELRQKAYEDIMSGLPGQQRQAIEKSLMVEKLMKQK